MTYRRAARRFNCRGSHGSRKRQQAACRKLAQDTGTKARSMQTDSNSRQRCKVVRSEPDTQANRPFRRWIGADFRALSRLEGITGKRTLRGGPYGRRRQGICGQHFHFAQGRFAWAPATGRAAVLFLHPDFHRKAHQHPLFASLKRDRTPDPLRRMAAGGHDEGRLQARRWPSAVRHACIMPARFVADRAGSGGRQGDVSA